jgi:hypothetical protein
MNLLASDSCTYSNQSSPNRKQIGSLAGDKEPCALLSEKYTCLSTRTLKQKKLIDATTVLHLPWTLVNLRACVRRCRESYCLGINLNWVIDGEAAQSSLAVLARSDVRHKQAHISGISVRSTCIFEWIPQRLSRIWTNFRQNVSIFIESALSI